MNIANYGERNPAAPSATVNTLADRELARKYLARCGASDLLDMLGLGGAS